MTVSSYNNVFQKLSRWRFFLVSAAAVIGLGNIWGFPYVVGHYGGTAFLLVYAVFLLLIAVPVLLVVILLGRRSHLNPIDTVRNLVLEQGRSRHWGLLGWGGTIAGLAILSYYSVFAGESMAYVFRAASGLFTAQTLDGVASIHQSFQGNPESLLAWHTIFMVLTMIIVSRGVHDGIASSVAILAPIFVLCLVALLSVAVLSDGFDRGVDFLFHTDVAQLFYRMNSSGVYLLDLQGQRQLRFDGILQALESAFYTVSLGMMALMAYSTSLPRKSCVVQTVFGVVLADLLVGLIAGLVVTSFIFGGEMPMHVGTLLAFESLPITFGDMAGGDFVGMLFYLLLMIAALTTSVALAEPAVIWLMENRAFTRVQACVWIGIVVWLLGVFTVFSLTGVSLADLLPALADWFGGDELAGDTAPRVLTAFHLLDVVAAKWLLPLVALFLVLFAGWGMDPESLKQEVEIRYHGVLRPGFWLIRYLTPALLFVVFLRAVGVFD